MYNRRSMTHPLDYTALEGTLEKTEVDAYKQNRVGNAPPLYISRGKTAIIPLVLFSLWVLYISFRSGSVLPALFFISLVTIIGFFYWVSYNNSIKLRARLFKFAAQNNLEWIEGVLDPHYSGMIFDNGHSRRIDEALRFKNGTEIGNFTYITGSGKNQRSFTWGYVRIKLVRRLPHMVLDAKDNNVWRRFSSLSDSFDRSQVLSLEGNFDDYFTLYAPIKYERDALYVFTPDVMAALIDHGRQYDIEIIDDELFIYNITRFKLETPQLYGPLLKIINTIGGELVDQTDYYADERVGDRTANIVAPAGRRLRSGYSWLVVVMVVVIIYFGVIQPLLQR